MKKQTSHGGARPKSGRKPVADPKEGLTIYIERSKIEANGGKDQCRELMIEFLSTRAEGKKKKKN